MAGENQNNNQKAQYGVSTDEIMDYLKDNMVTEEEFRDLKDKMVTKDDLRVSLNKQKLEILDHMDDKLANLKGDLVVLMRKEDRKLIALTELLIDKKVITASEAKGIFQMEPFPQLMV